MYTWGSLSLKNGKNNFIIMMLYLNPLKVHQIILAKEEMANEKHRKHFFFQREMVLVNDFHLRVCEEQFVEINANL